MVIFFLSTDVGTPRWENHLFSAGFCWTLFLSISIISQIFWIITPAGVTDSDYSPGFMPVKRHSRNSGVPIIWGLSKFSLVMMVCGRKIKGLNFLNFLFNLWLNIFRIKFFNILIVFILSFWNIFFQLQRHYFLRQVFSNHTLIFWSTWLCQNDLQIACRQENLAQSFGNLPIHWYFLFLWIPPSSSSFSVKTFLHLQWRQRLKVELIF